jgi:phosphatidate cytidylyltransferase
MPLNFQTLKTRALTAIVFVAVMLAGIMYNSFSLRALLLIIQVGATVELLALIQRFDANYKKFPLPLLKYIALIFVYIILPATALFNLYEKSNLYFIGPHWVTPMLIIASIWINDTMAYLVGSLIGKTTLSSISPKKTIEGTLGGIILTVMAIGFGAHSIWGFALTPLLLIAATAAIFGTLGDLFESKLKRMADVKDSGHFMPGHGGFLDRFDSLLFAAPAVWLVLYLFY